MARDIGQDFERVQQFISEYRIPSTSSTTGREIELKKMHKKTIGALQLWVEVQKKTSAGGFELCGTDVPIGSPAYAQIAESYSDLTSAFGVTIHGFVKPASMCLRSCIETFIRGTCGASQPQCLTERNVYRLMELAKANDFFAGSSRQFFQALHQTYKELCLVAHSSPRYLAKIGSLEDLTRYVLSDLRRTVASNTAIVHATSGALVAAAPSLLVQAKSNASQVLEEVVPLEVRVRALRGS